MRQFTTIIDEASIERIAISVIYTHLLENKLMRCSFSHIPFLRRDSLASWKLVKTTKHSPLSPPIIFTPPLGISRPWKNDRTSAALAEFDKFWRRTTCSILNGTSTFISLASNCSYLRIEKNCNHQDLVLITQEIELINNRPIKSMNFAQLCSLSVVMLQ